MHFLLLEVAGNIGLSNLCKNFVRLCVLPFVNGPLIVTRLLYSSCHPLFISLLWFLACEISSRGCHFLEVEVNNSRVSIPELTCSMRERLLHFFISCNLPPWWEEQTVSKVNKISVFSPFCYPYFFVGVQEKLQKEHKSNNAASVNLVEQPVSHIYQPDTLEDLEAVHRMENSPFLTTLPGLLFRRVLIQNKEVPFNHQQGECA